jgi:pilus assembly protein CpaB
MALAVGLASAAWLATRNWVAGEAAAASETAVAMADVLVAAHSIEAGATLAAADLRWQPWPVAAVDRSWLVRGNGAAPAVTMNGQVVQVRLAAGVPITTAMAVPPGNGSAFAAAIRPGWRAATIAVTPAAGLAGFVEPGDRVDLLLTQTLGNRRTVQTMLADLGVLGVDQRQRGGGSGKTPLATAGDVVADAAAASGAEPPNLITLEVTPRQAEAIAVSAELGRLSLALRGPGREPASAGGRRWDSDVTGLSAAQLAAGSSAAASFAPPAASAPALALRTEGAENPTAKGPRGVEIVYGAPPATPAAPEAAK